MSRVLGVLCILAVGCSSYIHDQAASTTYRVLVRSTQAARAESDLELARAAMPGGLMQLEAFALAYPDHPEFRDLHAETLCQYAVAFVFDDWEDATLAGRTDDAERIAARLGRLLERCIDANVARLPAAWRSGPEGWAAHAPALSRSQVAPALWIALAAGMRLAIDPFHHLADLPAIESVLTRCTELAPGFHDADGELMLATLTAARAQVFGGDDGAELFARAHTLAGDGALMVEVLFARGTAVARKDRALFEATLTRVLDPARVPRRAARGNGDGCERPPLRHHRSCPALWLASRRRGRADDVARVRRRR
ncbi:hypothetical protein BH11MYX3_BH11MYX3_21980 [soil metagenome]